VEHCDVLFLNEVELAGLSGNSNVTEGLRTVSNGRTIVVAKLGKRGCAALAAGRYYSAEAIEVEAIDTTGAGDSFNAGFLHAWLRRLPIESCLECGSICGGLFHAQVRRLRRTSRVGGRRTTDDSTQEHLIDHGRYQGFTATDRRAAAGRSRID
jgi:sugar/nucleoside kinase (ribokinase family)